MDKSRTKVVRKCEKMGKTSVHVREARESGHTRGRSDMMNERKLKETAARHAPAAHKGAHIFAAFVSGGIIGMFGQLLLVAYQRLFRLPYDQALAMMSVSVMLIAAILSGLGRYDKLAQKCGAGMFVPICGFANSLTASAMEGKSEGPVQGIGSGMFKLAGTVITYGVVSAVVFGAARYLLFGGAL